MSADVATDNYHVSRSEGTRTDPQVMVHGANSRRGNKHTMTPAVIDHFGVAGYNPHPGLERRLPHRESYPPQRFGGKALLKDKRRAQIQRLCPAHGKIVDGAVDGQCPDVSTGEKEGIDDIRIGGESKLGSCYVEKRSVMV